MGNHIMPLIYIVYDICNEDGIRCKDVKASLLFSDISVTYTMLMPCRTNVVIFVLAGDSKHCSTKYVDSFFILKVLDLPESNQCAK